MSFKNKAIATLEAYQGNSKGLYASTVAGCIEVIRAIPEDNGWISVKDRLPEAEERVLLMSTYDDGKGRTFHDVMCGFYEDGNMWREDSKCNWDYEMMQLNLYDEDRDDYRVPEGWYEELNNRIEDYNVVAIPDLVTHWRPLPEGPKEEK